MCIQTENIDISISEFQKKRSLEQNNFPYKKGSSGEYKYLN